MTFRLIAVPLMAAAVEMMVRRGDYFWLVAFLVLSALILVEKTRICYIGAFSALGAFACWILLMGLDEASTLFVEPSAFLALVWGTFVMYLRMVFSAEDKLFKRSVIVLLMCGAIFGSTVLTKRGSRLLQEERRIKREKAAEKEVEIEEAEFRLSLKRIEFGERKAKN